MVSYERVKKCVIIYSNTFSTQYHSPGSSVYPPLAWRLAAAAAAKASSDSLCRTSMFHVVKLQYHLLYTVNKDILTFGDAMC